MSAPEPPAPERARRAVRCNGRWIDYDAALAKMDPELLREALGFAEDQLWHERRWDENYYADLEANGGVEAEYAAAQRALPDFRADLQHRQIFDNYASLHKSKFGEPFNPDLPEVPEPDWTPAQEAHHACWVSFRDRLGWIRKLSVAEVDRDEGMPDIH